EWNRLDAEIEAAKKDLAAVSNDALAAGRATWEADVRRFVESPAPQTHGNPDAEKRPIWTSVTPVEASSSGGSTMTIEPEGAVFVSGTLPIRDTYTVTIPASLSRIAAIRLQVLGDERLLGNG